MFSGIIEAKSKISSAILRDEVVEIHVDCPKDFKDLSLGDSIAVNGVCLTVEAFSDDDIQFAVAHETLKITGWSVDQLVDRNVNLERSVKIGDRIHGHIVSGHVDAVGEVAESSVLGESLLLKIRFGADIAPYIWRKGSVALNGVSLTINDVENDVMEFCLIPETLKRTNLGDLKAGDSLNIEADFMARGFVRNLELQKKENQL